MNSQQTDNEPPVRTREEQEELARICRLSALGHPLKIEILTSIDLFDLPALLHYLPDVSGSFREAYTQRQVAIHKAILNQRFKHEWRFIAPDGATWDPLAPIPQAYRKTIRLIINRQKLPLAPEDISVNQWPNKTARYQAVVSGGLVFLRFLQHIDARVSRTERKLLREWRLRYEETETGRRAWILPWAERNLHRALLLLWKINLLPTSPENREDVKEKIQRLTCDEGKLLIQLSEATASWQLERKAEEIAVEEPTVITTSSWMYRYSLLIQDARELPHPLGPLESFFVGGYRERRVLGITLD